MHKETSKLTPTVTRAGGAKPAIQEIDEVVSDTTVCEITADVLGWLLRSPLYVAVIV